MNLRYPVLLFLFFPAFVAAPAGEASFIWKADIRVRGESDGRDFRNATAPNFYSLLRARLGVEIRPVPDVKAVVQAQDSRVLGEEKSGSSFSTLANTRNLDLHQAYFELSNLFAGGLSVAAGRMELAYGNQRLIGAVDWNNVGRSFDGLRVRYDADAWQADLFSMNTGETNVPPSAATPPAVAAQRDTGSLFSGLYASLRMLERHQLDTYLLHEWTRSESVPGSVDLSRFTAGAFLKGATEGFLYDAELAGQFGTKSGMTVRAFLVAIQAGYTVGEPWLQSVNLGADYLSGTAAGSAAYGTFDPSFHTGHKFYGFMDYFIAIPSNTRDLGLQDLYLRCAAQPAEAITLGLWAHVFSGAAELNGARAFGQEVDVTAAWSWNPAVSIEVGAAAFFPGELFRSWFGGADVGLWAFLSARVRV
jgi:hypothetical protein